MSVESMYYPLFCQIVQSVYMFSFIRLHQSACDVGNVVQKTIYDIFSFFLPPMKNTYIKSIHTMNYMW